MVCACETTLAWNLEELLDGLALTDLMGTSRLIVELPGDVDTE